MNRAVESVSAFFPCYNDEATIGAMVEAAASTLDRVGADGEIIVVNDGSSDGSERVLKHLTETEPRLRVVTHEHNRGYGGALLSGFGAATITPTVTPIWLAGFGARSEPANAVRDDLEARAMYLDDGATVFGATGPLRGTYRRQDHFECLSW